MDKSDLWIDSFVFFWVDIGSDDEMIVRMLLARQIAHFVSFGIEDADNTRFPEVESG